MLLLLQQISAALAGLGILTLLLVITLKELKNQNRKT